MLKVRQPLNTERENFQPFQLVPALLCLVTPSAAIRACRCNQDGVDGERLPVPLDLENVTLMDINVIRFLNAKKLAWSFSIAGPTYGNG
jgi:hypothetical protein